MFQHYVHVQWCHHAKFYTNDLPFGPDCVQFTVLIFHNLHSGLGPHARQMYQIDAVALPKNLHKPIFFVHESNSRTLALLQLWSLGP